MCGVMGYGVSFEGFLSNTGQQWWPRGGCRCQDALPPPLLTHTKDGQDSPSRWDTRAFLRMFLPRSTSLSVALVQRRILKQGWGAHSESRCYLLAPPHPAQRPLSPQVLPGWHSPLALQEEHHVIDSHSVTDKVCAQQARLCVADAEGLETLAQLVGHSD